MKCLTTISLVFLCLMCALPALAQDTGERIAYYTQEESAVRVYFLDPVTRTTSQHSFEVSEHEIIRQGYPQGEQITFLIEDRRTTAWSWMQWNPLDGTQTDLGSSRPQWSSDGRFIAYTQAEAKTRKLIITVQDTLTGTRRVFVVPGYPLENELVWAHHRHQFAIASSICIQSTCDETRLLILDVDKGRVILTLPLPTAHFHGTDDDYSCHFEWSPDDRTVVFLAPCITTNPALTPVIYSQRLTEPYTQHTITLFRQWVPASQIHLTSHVTTTWFDETHLIIGTAGVSQWHTPAIFDPRLLHTYLYDIESDELTPFLNQYTAFWKQLQPGLFSYEGYSFSRLRPYDVESRVEQLTIARFDGTAVTVLDSLPSNPDPDVNAAGTFLSYVQGSNEPQDDDDIIRVVSLADNNSYTYVTPQNKAHYIGWVTITP